MSKSPLVFLIAFLACLWSAAPIPAQGAALRICADPDYLPYSNRAGQGFENKIAEAVAKALGEPLEYTWESTRSRGGFPEFLARTLDANKCDAVMNIPYGSREELTTQPYYASSYVFVFNKSRNYDIRSLDSQILKRIKIGFENDTPVEDGLKIRGLSPATIDFDVGSTSTDSSEETLNALVSGQLDVLIRPVILVVAILTIQTIDVVSWPAKARQAPAEGKSEAANTEKLLADGDCRSCHAPDRKVVGPSYSDIARRYAAQADAVAKL